MDLFGGGISSEDGEFDRFFPDGCVPPDAMGMDVLTECFVGAAPRA